MVVSLCLFELRYVTLMDTDRTMYIQKIFDLDSNYLY